MDTGLEAGQWLWLVRHGESTWNVLGLVQGHADGPTLSPKGVRQSRRVARGFRRRPVSLLVTSDLPRARQTADPIARSLGLEARIDARLRERSLGVFEGSPGRLLPPGVTGIDGDRVLDVDFRPPGGESLMDLSRRVGDFLEWLRQARPVGDVVVVGHGGSIRAIEAHLDGVDIEARPWGPCPNATVRRHPLSAIGAAAPIGRREAIRQLEGGAP